MAEYPQHFKPGDPLKLSAAMFNDMLAVIRLWKRGEIGVPARSQDTRPLVARIRNDTGEDLPLYGVVALGDLVNEPESLGDDPGSDPLFKGIIPASPEHCGRFAILTAPIADGRIGRGVVVGQTRVKVDVTDVNHRFADITDADCSMLTSRDIGGAEIMHNVAEVGEQIVYVRTGLHVPRMRTATLDYNLHHGETTDATFVDEARTVEVVCPLVKSGYGLASGTTLIMFPQPDVDAWLGFAVDDCVQLVADLAEGSNDPDYEP